MTRRFLALIPLAFVASPGGVIAQDSPFAACREKFAAKPDDRAAAACFANVARDQALWTDGEREIDDQLRTHPNHPGLLLARGHLAGYQSHADAPERYAEAASAFAAIGGHRGVAIANINRANALTLHGRHDEAAAALDDAMVAAAETGDASLLAAVRSQSAAQMMRNGGDLSQAYRLLRDVEDAIFPDGPPTVQVQCLYNLGKVTAELGRWSEAVEYYERAMILAHEQGNRFAEATFRMNLVEAMVAVIEDSPRDARVDPVIAATRQALAAAETADNRLIAAKAHMLLGDLLTSDDAVGHTRTCIDIAQAGEAPELERACTIRLAMHLVETDRDRARALSDEAYGRARALGVRRGIALAATTRSFVSRRTGTRPEAIERSLDALHDIELARDVQRDELVRARYFSRWLAEYYKLAGFLLGEPAAQPAPADLDLAFVVVERMRGRVLLEALDLVGATPIVAADTPGREQRDAVLDQIAAVQRELVDAPNQDETTRAPLLSRLEKLEREEAELRDAMARVDARFAAMRAPSYATIGAVQRALGADQALLSYVVAPWTDLFGYQRGGSWVIAVWRDGVFVAPLPDRQQIADQVDAFTGLVQRRDDLDVVPAGALGATLVSAALDELPTSVRRLVVIADGALHRLPFAALRHRDHRLSDRYELTTAPSATLWLRWMGHAVAGTAERYLALADPTRASTGAVTDDAVRGDAFDGADLAPLPGSRDEVAKMAAHLGASTVTRVGDDASELMLKNTDLSEFALLHFASHAIVDDLVPRRSGVVLAPGDAVQDGLLQLHEVVALGLNGQVVVLSSCESASGAFVGGEGVNGLSRAFLQAGAGVVVANLWRVRDDESAQMFDEFYRHLARGKSVAAALAATQRALSSAGVPAVAWAGVVVIGDGDLVLFPDAKSGPRDRFRHWYAGVIALLALGLLVCASRVA